MTHLGERVTRLVDGQLAPDAAERALVHVAHCPRCAAEVAAERSTRRRLQEATDPTPSPDLVAGLLAMGGPQGPFGPRPGHVPGTPRPPALPVPAAPWDSRPAGRRDAVRPGGARRSRRSRLATAAAGALSLASVGLVGLLVLGAGAGGARQDPGAPVVALGASALGLGAAAVPAVSGSAATLDELDDAELAALREDGWPCPATLAGGLRLVEARSLQVGGAPVVHLTYSDGDSTVTVVEQRGRVAADEAAAFSQALAAAAATAGREQAPWHGVWQSGEVVVAVVADAPPEVLAGVVEALPHQPPPDGWRDRLGRGADVVGALLGDR